MLKIYFQDGCQGAHLGFLIRMILTILGLQNTLVFPTKLGVNWPFGSEVLNRFLRLPTRRTSWISDWDNFSDFLSTSHPNTSSKFGVKWPFCSEVQNRFSNWQPWQPFFSIGSYFLPTGRPDTSYNVSSQLTQAL